MIAKEKYYMKKEATLNRTLFELSRECEFFTEKELEMQIGHEKAYWYTAIIKELIDNSLDACEIGNISPEIEVSITDDYFEIKDNGPGLPTKTIEGSLNYLLRVSDKQFYVSPTRGQMGNALKTVWAVPFVANGQGKVEIDSMGQHHVIETSLDRIAQKPKIEHNYQENASEKNGTIVRIYWNNSARLKDEENMVFYNAFRIKGPTVKEIVSAYALFNPHASFVLRESSEVVIDDESRDVSYKATKTDWKKWRTDMPTSSHWYTEYTLRDLIAAYVGSELNNGNKPKTVREFVSEFRGLSSTIKQKEITSEFSGVFLHDLIKDEDINMETVKELLNIMKVTSNPVKPQSMGLIGKEHFMAWLKTDYEIIEESFNYDKKIGFDDNGLPYVFEFAFVVKKDTEDTRTIVTGLNWTPTLGIPAREINEAIGKCRVDRQDPVVLIIHLVKPRFEFVDRGKTRIAI